METKHIKITELVENRGQIPGLPTNPRQWKRAELDRLKKSLQDTPELFEARGVIVYPYNSKYVVLGGNMRLSASRALNLKDIPCIIVPESTPVDKLKEIVIKDNGAFGEWDFDQLANEWDNLPLSDWGVPAWETEPVTMEGEQTIQEDDFDETKEEIQTRCKPGDVWKLGDHVLICGDSTNPEVVAKLMDGQKANMMFTDPPYGYKYEHHIDNPKFEMIKNDDKILNFFPAVEPHVTGFVFVCTAWKVLDKWIPLFKKYYRFSNMVIWDKGGGGMGDLTTTFSTDYEIILVSYNNAKITGKRLGSVWRVGKDDVNSYVHPTQKPVGLSAIAIENTTNPGDIVLDVFGGSGSTMMSCEQLNRKCRMIELDEHYCDVILARWEKLTGKEAVKI